MKPLLLDLYSGAGGAGHGYALAGFEVVGVDRAPMRRYPYEFVQADALEMLDRILEDPAWNRFDAIHASPPCQRFSRMTRRHGPERASAHPDLIASTRERLEAIGRPYVIENVETARAELRDPIRLCGSAFGLGVEFEDEWLGLRRHRLFETNFALEDVPGCAHVGRALPVYGNAGGRSKRDGLRFPGTDAWRAGMGIPWMTGQELGEAIPPAYTQWIGEKLLAVLEEGGHRWDGSSTPPA